MLFGRSVQERGTGLPQDGDSLWGQWWQGHPGALPEGHRRCYPPRFFVRGMRTDTQLGRWGGPCWPGRYRSHLAQGISAPAALPPST